MSIYDMKTHRSKKVSSVSTNDESIECLFLSLQNLDRCINIGCMHRTSYNNHDVFLTKLKNKLTTLQPNYSTCLTH